MTTGIARIGLFAVALILAIPAPTAAGPGSGTDPDDVVSRLDLKTLSHADDGSAITYTAETYEAFPDRPAAFKWGIDKNGDECFDLVVFAEWDEGRLVAGVDDAKENKVASATVSRPAPNAITVSFPAAVLGGATSYRYGAIAEDDRNGNGESDPGEQDLAPDSGLYRHDLGAAASAPAPASPAPASPAPAARPAPATPVAAPSRPAAAPAEPRPVGATEVAPGRSPANPRAPQAAPTPPPAAPKPPAAAAAAPGSPPAPRPSPAAPAPPANLARTGSTGTRLASLAGALFIAGGLLFMAGTLMPRAGESR